MKKIMEWLDAKVLSSRKTVFVGIIGMLILDGLLWEKIPNAVSYVLYVIIGLICLASVLRSWAEKKKLKLVFIAFCGLSIVIGSAGLVREIGDGRISAPAKQSRQYAEVEASQPTGSGNTGSGKTSSGKTSSGSGSLYDYDNECPTCLGLKECSHCFGEGEIDCTQCVGGRCISCSGGKELVSFDSKGNPRYRDCSKCTDERCNKCGGDGYVDCRYCTGGRCSTCNGRGTI